MQQWNISFLWGIVVLDVVLEHVFVVLVLVLEQLYYLNHSLEYQVLGPQVLRKCEYMEQFIQYFIMEVNELLRIDAFQLVQSLLEVGGRIIDFTNQH